jgi:hypothetical protein
VSMLSQGFGALAGAISGAMRGGIPGALIGGVAGWQGGGGAGTSITKATPTMPMGAPPAGPSGGGGITIGGPYGIDIFSGQNPFSYFGKGAVAGTGAGSCPKGYHLNKHPLAASKHHGAMPAHSMCVRNRHMHPLNSRAIVRSLRRIKRASKIVRKLHAFGGVRAVAGRRSGHRPGCRCVTCRR